MLLFHKIGKDEKQHLIKQRHSTSVSLKTRASRRNVKNNKINSNVFNQLNTNNHGYLNMSKM
jgi:hypothetical protein